MRLTLPTIAYPFDRQTLQRGDVADCAARLLELAGYGRLPFERAAFLILRTDGRFDCSPWPATFQRHSESWSGGSPEGTAAIIHTHPWRAPHPSRQDIEAAGRIGVPIIVVTHDAMTMAQPNGEVLK